MPDEVQASDDQVAGDYVARIADELDHKPLDRQLLDRFAERVKSLGPVCDVGCGPGHVARYLTNRGVLVLGIDLSHAMVLAARRRYPANHFQLSDLRSLPVDDDPLGGSRVLSPHPHPRPEIVAALVEMRRATSATPASR